MKKTNQIIKSFTQGLPQNKNEQHQILFTTDSKTDNDGKKIAFHAHLMIKKLGFERIPKTQKKRKRERNVEKGM